MNYKTKALAERFHGYRDNELVFELRPRTVEETKETRYVILQEREVSYRFYLHQPNFSVKARQLHEEKEAVEQYGSSDSGASLGDILGAALKAKND